MSMAKRPNAVKLLLVKLPLLMNAAASAKLNQNCGNKRLLTDKVREKQVALEQ